MYISLTLIIVTICYLSSIAIIYNRKESLKNYDNKIYNYLLHMNIIGLIIELLCIYTVSKTTSNVSSWLIINNVVNRLFLTYLISWITLFTSYMVVSTSKKEISNKKVRSIILVIVAIMSLFSIVLPLEYTFANGYAYSYGLATDLVSLYGCLCILVDIGCLVVNKIDVRQKKYFPFIILIILTILVITIRAINPGLTVLNSIFGFIVFIMYFTIENPDLRMIEELSKRKDINDKVNEDKTNFLFHVTQTVKKTIDKIEHVSNYALNQQSIEEKDESIRTIKYIASNARIKVNETIDLSAMDAQNIKVMGNKYNFHNLVKEINLKTEKIVRENIEYRSYISSDIPDYLYGDSVKVKQILNTVLNNSIENTEKGFIELRVNSIQKYDICRLIITIEDSGKGMDIKTVNDILGSTKDLNEEELDKINELDLNLKMVRKLLKVIGGTLNIESNVGEGTVVTITINQKMIEEKNKNKEIEKYEKMIQNKKKVLVVIENEKNKKQIEKALSKYETKVSIVKSSQECLNRVRDGETYDYVFIQEDMSKINAKELVRKLNLEENFRSKVIVLREKQELEIIRENIENVHNYLYFPIKKEDIKNILETE